MSKVEKFEDLKVWQQSMILCKEIYAITNYENFAKDFGLKDQIRRSAISIPSNISEGYERDAQKQFLYFLAIAKGSCGELRTQLHLAFDLGYISEDEMLRLKELCIQTSKQLSGFISYLKNYKGNKENKEN